MNFATNLIAVLSFNDTNSRLATLLRKLYFAFGYNTTFPVNIMLTLGVISPYVLFQAARQDFSGLSWVATVGITLLAAYCYNLIYIVNDYIDHDKDILLRTPKQSAMHVLGKHYLPIVLGCFAAVIGVASLLSPSLFFPLVGYCLVLCGLSLLHSNFQSTKLLTVFLERFVKFCAPLWLVLIVTNSDDVQMMFAGALLIYPLGYTLDYAYRGYIRDRLSLNQSVRFIVYAAYYGVLSGLLMLDRVQDNVPLKLDPMLTFIGLFAATSLVSGIIANYLPFRFLDATYAPRVALEKRRLLTYGLIQTILLGIGGIYALAR